MNGPKSRDKVPPQLNLPLPYCSFSKRMTSLTPNKKKKFVGTALKGEPPRISRIEDVERFVRHAILFWFGGIEGSVFSHKGLHVTVWSYFLIGIATFFCATLALDSLRLSLSEEQQNMARFDVFTHESSLAINSYSHRILTFTLSAYLIQIIATYHKGIRTKGRNMMYGCSKSIDALSVGLNYDHDDIGPFLEKLHAAMTSIGQYALAVAASSTSISNSSEEEQAIRRTNQRKVFLDRNLDCEHLSSLPPKQALHILRLAILQSVKKERDKGRDGCLAYMNDRDFAFFRRDLNDYCGGASQVISSPSSSKLPYSYTSLLNWAVKSIGLLMQISFYLVAAGEWDIQNLCVAWATNCEPGKNGFIRPPPITWMHFLFLNIFQIVILYFLFGIPEVYVCVNDFWHSGVVLENYQGIIELICEPIAKRNRFSAPKNIEELCTRDNAKIWLNAMDR